MDWKKEQGRRLKAARKDKGLTQEQLAAAVSDEWGASRIGNYEQGTRGMEPPDAKVLGQILEVRPAFLLTVDDDADLLTERERKLLATFRAADDRGKATIQRVANAELQAPASNDR